MKSNWNPEIWQPDVNSSINKPYNKPYNHRLARRKGSDREQRCNDIKMLYNINQINVMAVNR